jgi:ABC-type bacteriocin/lantibiotic exporter with double-glycine peptidase domain
MAKNISRRNIENLFRVFKPYRKYIRESVYTGILLSILAIPGPWFTKILVDNVFMNGDIQLLYFIVITMGCFSIFQAVMKFIRDFYMSNISWRMTGDIQMLFLDHLQKMTFKFFNASETGEILARFSDISGTLTNSISVLNSLALNLVQSVIFPIVLFYVSWKLTLIAMIVLPFMIIVYFVSSKHIEKYTIKVTEEAAELNARIVETLEGIKTIQSLGIEDKNSKLIKDKVFNVLNDQSKLTVYYQGSVFLQETLKAIGTFLFSLFGWKFILKGDITLGVFLAFTNYVGYFYGPVFELLSMHKQIHSVFTHNKRFLEIYDLKPDISNIHKAIKPNRMAGHINFHNVSFGYYKGETILSKISIDLKPNHVTAIVGKSGAGKTTMVNLIPRFYDPWEGKITIDDHDLKRYQISYLRSKIGYVMQEPFIFNGTIRDNIILGIDADEDAFYEAVTSANVNEFVENMPDGFNTLVGQKGVSLSQGQKQRIAIARVLLQDAPVLILDEPTSSLDVESEDKIQKAMQTVCQNRTTIIIAHRLTTIREADNILVIDNGNIVETGRHEDLINKNLYYYKMCEKSARI